MTSAKRSLAFGLPAAAMNADIREQATALAATTSD